MTEVDRACEDLIVAGIQEERPGDAILAEEGGAREVAGAAWRWVVDPLDGTTNFAHAYPCFAVSIGVERDGESRVGVVYNPVLDELFHATGGGGAFCNGQAIQVTRETELGRSLVATGFAYDRRKSERDNLDELATFLARARAIRRDGSAALDLCQVACGRLDGYWEFKLAPWDVAAGRLILTEAGGRVSDARGGPAPASGAEMVASNGGIHDAMLETLAAAARGETEAAPR
ncbi:MAG: inositol monophosphatase [Myxococcales bacterium]|nr:inositol monophosphatase [Myxococcales bacterium]